MDSMGMIVVLLVAIALIIFLTIRVKVHAFVSLLLACLFIGFATNMNLLDILKSVEKGIGGFLGMLAPILALGAMGGKRVQEVRRGWRGP